MNTKTSKLFNIHVRGNSDCMVSDMNWFLVTIGANVLFFVFLQRGTLSRYNILIFKTEVGLRLLRPC